MIYYYALPILLEMSSQQLYDINILDKDKLSARLQILLLFCFFHFFLPMFFEVWFLYIVFVILELRDLPAFASSSQIKGLGHYPPHMVYSCFIAAEGEGPGCTLMTSSCLGKTLILILRTKEKFLLDLKKKHTR